MLIFCLEGILMLMREDHYPQGIVHTILKVNGNSPVVINGPRCVKSVFQLHDELHVFCLCTSYYNATNREKKGDSKKW